MTPGDKKISQLTEVTSLSNADLFTLVSSGVNFKITKQNLQTNLVPASSNLTEAVSSVLTITGGTNAVLGSGTTIEVKSASTTQKGAVQLTNDYTGTSESLAASQKCVHDAIGTIPAATSWTDSYTATLGQTVFTTTYSRLMTGIVVPTLNGQVIDTNSYTFTGTTFTYTGSPSLKAGDRVIVTYNYSPVVGDYINSVYGRTGDILPIAGDYLASQITNDSTVIGSYVSNALETLDAKIIPLYGKNDSITVSSDGQTSFPNALSETYYATSQAFATVRGQVFAYGIGFTISGKDVTWLNPGGFSLLTTDEFIIFYNYSPVGGAVVKSVFTRTGDITAQAGDYNASKITNDSGVSGTYVKDALNTLDGGKEPTLSKGNLTESTSSVLTISGGTGSVIGSGASIQVKQSSSSQSGYLSSTDWSTFNGKQNSLTIGNITGSSNQINVSGGTGAIIGSGVSLSLPSNLYTKSRLCPASYSANWGNWRVDTVGGTGTTRLPINVPSSARVISSVKIRFFVASGAAGSGRNIDLTTEYCSVGNSYNQYTQSDTTSTYDFTGLTDKLTELDVTSLFTNLAAGMAGTILLNNNAIGGNLYLTGVIINYLE